MRRIDYDTEQYQDYARGRALTEQQLQAWVSAFGALLPERRPLAGLDVGSGTGRFTPALARAFGPVTGVEPSVRMREIARARSLHPGVRYLAGSAEDMPVPSGSADTHSTFAHFTPDELETGFRRLEQAIAADPGAPAPADPATLLTLERR
jgi:ubiquinone/menaquinone biosynthesis C-methylase UbiE